MTGGIDMAYEFLAGKDIDLSCLGYEKAFVQFDFDKENSNLRITLFDNNHYKDQVVVNLEDEFEDA